MEPYPEIVASEVRGFVLSSSDVTVVYDSHGKRVKRVFWYSRNRGAVIDPLVRGDTIELPSGVVVDFRKWVEEMPILSFYTIRDLDTYVEFLANIVGPVIAGKTVMVSFSGGKDSYVALVVLAKLRERVPFRLVAVYSHMPVLEPRENEDIARREAEKLDIEFYATRPEPRIIRRYLASEGLPYRSARWCTYLKTRPIRELRKKLGLEYVVSGDRIVEAGKRFVRLVGSALRRKFIDGKQLRPTFTWTLFDVAKICRLFGYSHPDYLAGLSRVSCSFCPYKSLHEFTATRSTGYENLIEKVLKREYRVWYESRGIVWEDFVERALWRYSPQTARTWNELAEHVKKLAERGELEIINSNYIHKVYRSVWTEPLPQLPVEDLEHELEVLKRWAEEHKDKLETLIADR